MQNTQASIVLDQEDERIHGLSMALNERGVPGMSEFVCRPETKEVVGVLKKGSTVRVDYDAFERWFVEPARRTKLIEEFAPAQATDDERLATKILVNDLNGRIDPDSRIDRFVIDLYADEVVQIGTDGKRCALPVRGFVKLFTPRGSP